MKTYTIASVEGAERFGVPASPDDEALKVGDDVSLDLSDDQERALFAAGWLEPTTKKEK
jgi:hypothetical protein